jgi:ribosomal protein S18 acetylase RimI-like enzyme
VGVLGLVVRDEFQGMGMSSKLMNYMFALARREGIRKIRLTVFADNYRVIKLYEKFRFKKTNFIRECDTYGGKKHDCVEMWLDL